MGTASLLGSMSLDYYSVLNTLQKVIPASLAMALLGWIMGTILDKPRVNKGLNFNYTNLVLNKINNIDEDSSDKEPQDEEEDS